MYDMCNCQKNIESLSQVICALEDKNKQRNVVSNAVVLSAAELDGYFTGNSNKYLYGIFSVGSGTTFTFHNFGGTEFVVQENSQIIEFIEGIVDVTGNDNISFRGYEITVGDR